jgi:formamidopyrimidine-DNA glycosylase
VPELPEVETIARQLNLVLKKRKLIDLRLIDPKLRGFSSEKLRNKSLLQLTRSGKEILFVFSDEVYLRIHLRMTGRLVWVAGKKKLDSSSILVRKGVSDLRTKSVRAEFAFNGGTLFFEDVRRFGTINVEFKKREVKWIDPTSTDFTLDALKSLLKNSKQQMKIWLLRQDKLVGIGNIYASEILFRAGIRPQRAAGSLKPEEIKKLYSSTKYILEKAIELNGTTFSDYRDSEGETGAFQKFLAVYNREGEKCRKCKAEILCIRQGQRSTYYCTSCQK